MGAASATALRGVPGGKVQTTAVRGRDPRFAVPVPGWRRSEAVSRCAVKIGTFLFLRSRMRRSVGTAVCTRVATYRAVFLSLGVWVV